MHRVTVCADPETGEDAYEAQWIAPVLPRKGDLIEVSIATGSTHLKVSDVVFEYQGRIEVWVTGGERYELARLREALAEMGSEAAKAALEEDA